MSTNKMLYVTIFAAFLSSCASDTFVSHNGNMPSNERISRLENGQDKNEVQALLGAPSNVVSLDQNTWIYMSSEIKQVAFMKPQEIGRDVLTIKFDSNDKVSDIKRLTKKDGEEIVVSNDSTQTLGQDPGFFQKYFGGIGKYMPFPGMTNNQRL